MDRVILLCQIEFSGPKCNNISGVEVGALANDTTAASVTSITSEVNWCSAGIVEIDTAYILPSLHNCTDLIKCMLFSVHPVPLHVLTSEFCETSQCKIPYCTKE